MAKVSHGTPQQKAAKALVDAFALRTSAGVFTKIKRADVARTLRDRVDFPGAINQGTASLCPSAAMVYLEAKNRPIQYAQFVIDLYEKGRGNIGSWTVEPGTDLQNYALPAGASNPDPADWIPMASIRDSENWFFDYQKIGGYVPWSGGASPSEIANWMKKAGYTDVIRKDNIVFTNSKQNLDEARRLRGRGYKVLLLIDQAILTLPKKEWHDESPRWKGRGNHVVVLSSPVTFTRQSGKEFVKFTVFTWGQGKRSIIPRGASQIQLGVLLRHYYGFIAGKY